MDFLDTYWNEKMLIGMARNDPNCHGLTRPFPVQKHGLVRINRRGTVPDRFFCQTVTKNLQMVHLGG